MRPLWRITEETEIKPWVKYLPRIITLTGACIILVLFLGSIAMYATTGDTFRHFEEAMADLSLSIYIGVWILVVFTGLAGILGIVGVVIGSPMLVFTFGVLLAEMTLGQMVFGGTAIWSNALLNQAFESWLIIQMSTFDEMGHPEDSPNVVWTVTQIKLQCCGMSRRDDWPAKNRHYRESRRENVEEFPFSCCSDVFNSSSFLEEAGPDGSEEALTLYLRYLKQHKSGEASPTVEGCFDKYQPGSNDAHFWSSPCSIKLTEELFEDDVKFIGNILMISGVLYVFIIVATVFTFLQYNQPPDDDEKYIV